MEFKLVHELKSLHPGLIWWLEVKQGVAVTAGQEGNVNSNILYTFFLLIYTS